MPDARGGVASGAAGVRSGACRCDAVCGRGGGDEGGGRGLADGGEQGGDAVGAALRSVHAAGGDGDRVFGVIRPGWDVEGAEGACDVDGHSFYYAYNGYRQPDDSRWEGMQDAREQGDRIGVLLDLDRGSTTVWKNGVRLGVLQVPPVLSEEHPSGPLCWAVEMGAGGASVQIDSARAPTEEELATAKVDPEPSSESDDDDDE